MAELAIRTAAAADADAVYALIGAHQREGHLLPRSLDDVRRRASRFVVCDVDGEIKACAELAPLSAAVAEVRSLVVSESARHEGVATRLLTELERRARAGGFETLCAFSHDAGFFIRRNFSIVPHVWMADKIAADCAACPKFRRCGQFALVLPLAPARVVRLRPAAEIVLDRQVAVA